MAGFSTVGTDHLIRSNLWSSNLKEIFEAKLYANQWMNWITDFPDGDTLNIPSIGQMEAQDFAEGEAVRYTAMDTGNFTFTIDKYLASATYVTQKMLQDSYVMKQVQAMFVPKQARAIDAIIEADILALAPNAQTSANSNTINGAKHRIVGSGLNERIALEDFMKMKYALQLANAPLTQLIAVVHPSVEYELSTLPNHVNMSNNIHWEGVVATGLTTGMRFVKNIFGWDVYVSQYIKTNTASEAIDGVTAAAGVNNVFFTAAPEARPFIGSIRQAPKVESEFNKDLQRDEYVTTCRYGMKLFRPECVGVVVTDTDQVYA
jgi:HK97 family phage major capsid protein